IEVEGFRIRESEVIFEYLEEAYPDSTPLLPKHPLERARVRELVTFIELHMELVVRRLYPAVFFGGKVSDEVRQQADLDIKQGIRAFNAFAKSSPFVAGKDFTVADCAAGVHLPLVSLATRLAFQRDYLEDIPQAKEYLAMIKQRPAFAKVDADRKA